MFKIDSVGWGKIEVNDQGFQQVLIIEGQVFERDSEKLRQFFDTSHKIGDWEIEELFRGDPEAIIIGTGWDGVLQPDEKIKKKSEKLGVELIILKTPPAVEEYNRLAEEGKKVNALIHTTC